MFHAVERWPCGLRIKDIMSGKRSSGNDIGEDAGPDWRGLLDCAKDLDFYCV